MVPGERSDVGVVLHVYEHDVDVGMREPSQRSTSRFQPVEAHHDAGDPVSGRRKRAATRSCITPAAHELPQVPRIGRSCTTRCAAINETGRTTTASRLHGPGTTTANRDEYSTGHCGCDEQSERRPWRLDTADSTVHDVEHDARRERRADARPRSTGEAVHADECEIEPCRDDEDDECAVWNARVWSDLRRG